MTESKNFAGLLLQSLLNDQNEDPRVIGVVSRSAIKLCKIKKGKQVLKFIYKNIPDMLSKSTFYDGLGDGMISSRALIKFLGKRELTPSAFINQIEGLVDATVLDPCLPKIATKLQELVSKKFSDNDSIHHLLVTRVCESLSSYTACGQFVSSYTKTWSKYETFELLQELVHQEFFADLGGEPASFYTVDNEDWLNIGEGDPLELRSGKFAEQSEGSSVDEQGNLRDFIASDSDSEEDAAQQSISDSSTSGVSRRSRLNQKNGAQQTSRRRLRRKVESTDDSSDHSSDSQEPIASKKKHIRRRLTSKQSHRAAKRVRKSVGAYIDDHAGLG